MSSILLQARALPWGWSLGEVAMLVIVLAAIVAVVFIAVRAMNIPVPQWVIHIGMVLAIAFVAILAVRVLMSM